MIARLACAAVIAACTLPPAPATAQCRMASIGAGCATAPIRRVSPPDPGPPPVDIGEILDRGRYSMLMNAGYYGLPLPQDGWVYFRIERDIYRVDYRTMEVLERATAEAARNWP
ncbi:hypothetical protein EU805_05845 [Salipiger sp. IMCC34102]|uniref:hypothetical protein n=1 Tax=Salipiger sp. IMCC34102 TaxID=2510647 RepID=UPI00101DC058|nr:hypothetical protein [Salipiger sp. IMCC34102]RYH03245.1 hypothetical protein EU805_05845 [Salipiger sp. IMCC34102]